MATNDYRAYGGGDFPGANSGNVVLEGTETTRTLVLRHIARAGIPAGATDESWRLLPCPGTSALFDTGPGALAHLADLKDLRIEPAGMGPDSVPFAPSPPPFRLPCPCVSICAPPK